MMLTRSATRPGEAGFTLLELMVVLAVLALATVIALPLARSPAASREFDGTVRDIVGMLRTTRLAAVASNAQQVAIFDLAARTYSAAGIVASRQLPARLSLAITTPAGEQQGPARYSIRFLPDGSTTGAHLQIRSGTAAAEIALDWLSGRVSVSRSKAP